MSNKYKSNGGVNLLDAVEALETIAETSWEQETVYHEDLAAPVVNWKSIDWLKNGDKESAVENIKNIFRVILDHLKTSIQEQNPTADNMTGITTIMLLVGEAAKKIDRYTDLFHTQTLQSVTETREYQQLQEFYNKKISKTINEVFLGKWILALSQRVFKEHEKSFSGEKLLDTKHVFVDLDSVKNDTEYELFFIRKADGDRFFSPRLIRNIKLVCDFGFKLGGERDRDPLVDLNIWSDRWGYGIAGMILSSIKGVMAENYPLIIHHKEMPFCASVHKTILALFLASSQGKLLSSGSTKGCLSYLSNFQEYLRESLQTRSFQSMSAFPHQEFSNGDKAAKKIVDGILKAIFEGQVLNQRLSDFFSFLVSESNEALSQDHKRAINLDYPLWSKLAFNFTAMQKFLRHHPNGPLNKVLTLLEEGNYHVFDPLMQMKLPEVLFRLNREGKETIIHRMASPTSQEVINKAESTLEWLGYLQMRGEKDEKVLLINFQDSTSWREHARCDVLENLSFEKFLSVSTLAKDTEFYMQDMPYQEDHQLQIFKNNLFEHVLGDHTGYHFSEQVRDHLTPDWLEGVFSAVNTLFFSTKNVLSKESRKDFIEIFYVFLELKMIEVSEANHVFLVCKDGVDICPTAACCFYILMKILGGQTISAEEISQLTEMIYRPALLSRERLLLASRAERMLSTIKVMENAVHDNGEEAFKKSVQRAFSPFFKSDLSNIKIE